MGRMKLAIRSYNKALKISPQNTDALLNKGTALHSSQNYAEALECYDAVLKIDKNVQWHWHTRVCLLAKLENCKMR